MSTATHSEVNASGTEQSRHHAGPILRNWQRLYRATINFRGKGKVLFDWPGRFVRRWPVDVSIRSREGCLFLHCDLNDYLFRSLFFFGFHEIDVDWMCAQLLRRDDVFIDIGACYGYHALSAAGRVGPQGRVYAIEPQPDVFAILQQNAECNCKTNIELDNLALSDRTEQIELHRFADLGMGHTSIARMAQDISRVYLCEAITLDEYMARKLIKSAALIKLDVEGAELKILKGAQAALRGPYPPMLILEVNMETAEACGYHPRDLLSSLNQCGYQAYRPVWGKTVREIRRLEFCPVNEIQHGQNLLCAVPSMHMSQLARVGAS